MTFCIRFQFGRAQLVADGPVSAIESTLAQQAPVGVELLDAAFRRIAERTREGWLLDVRHIH